MHVQSFPFPFSFPVPDFLSRSRPFTLLYPFPLPVLPFLLRSNRLLLLSLTDMQTTGHNLIP